MKQHGQSCRAVLMQPLQAGQQKTVVRRRQQQLLRRLQQLQELQVGVPPTPGGAAKEVMPKHGTRKQPRLGASGKPTVLTLGRLPRQPRRKRMRLQTLGPPGPSPRRLEPQRESARLGPTGERRTEQQPSLGTTTTMQTGRTRKRENDRRTLRTLRTITSHKAHYRAKQKRRWSQMSRTSSSAPPAQVICSSTMMCQSRCLARGTSSFSPWNPSNRCFNSTLTPSRKHWSTTSRSASTTPQPRSRSTPFLLPSQAEM
mmetsp:Transcript_10689/g.23573  ORF Transcript_10689/g.23573 Transcript_10689/m.23573 type:complete len:257 (-) Transcript_10689:1651-2421(-)